MIRPLLLVLVAWLCSSFAPVQAVDPPAPQATQPPVSIRVHAMLLTVQDTWFEDRWGHALGAGVKRSVTGTMDEGVTIEFSSVEARKTSGCSIALRLTKGPAKDTLASATGMWWLDFGAKGSETRGHLTDITGDVYLSQSSADSAALVVKFSVRAKAKGQDVLLMGGSHVVVPSK